ncbi:glycosyltransferase family 4 protein [Bacteroides stercorirosoris]|uniref:Glycosyltransferase involved in cell wall bisynthesis n=1 Tax=Bacteroides stercorirosoris TaxID=871324 RepID=A0A1M6JP32_9BACE|nr:glycosyltransferase family 4 protein [Bacteroides stercorirosoris]SHJ48450.1 Glycosyltransferase involved in cell wall bisynthesis [Bacteroides stercorirosoris]
MNNLLHVVNISFVLPYFIGKQFLYFHQNGYNEYVICSPSDELLGFAQKYQFKYKEVDILRKISVGKDIRAIVSIMKYINQNHIDIVTGHTPKGALLAMVSAYIMQVPIRIYFRHGLVYETSKGVKRFLLMSMDRLAAKLATKIVCVSPSVCKRSIEDKLNPASKQVLLSKGTCNGIDISRFDRQNVQNEAVQDLKDKLGLPEKCFVIGFIGRLVRDKGIIELVQAFALLRQKFSDMRLLLVGMLEERDALPETIVEDIRKNPAIITTGYVQNSIIENYYALMDVFVLPSYREGFPTSVLEASSMGIPVITTKATGCIDSIIEEETGIFVPHDAGCFATAIETLYGNKDLRLQYGKNGRKLVEENYEQHIIWKEIEKLYIKTL